MNSQIENLVNAVRRGVLTFDEAMGRATAEEQVALLPLIERYRDE